MLATVIRLPVSQHIPIIQHATPASSAPRCQCENHSKYVAGCDECRAANAAYARWRRRQIVYGRMVRHIDAGPACQYLAELAKVCDMCPDQLAPVVGVSPSTICRLLSGRQAKVKPQTAESILALTPAKIRAAVTTGTASVLGSSRRLQALHAIRWPVEKLASMLGVPPETVVRWMTGRTNRGRIGIADHRRVADLYRQLCNRPGPDAAAARHAREKGYPPPICWDGDTDIDNPASKPKQYNAFITANPDPSILPRAL